MWTACYSGSQTVRLRSTVYLQFVTWWHVNIPATAAPLAKRCGRNHVMLMKEGRHALVPLLAPLIDERDERYEHSAEWILPIK